MPEVCEFTFDTPSGSVVTALMFPGESEEDVKRRCMSERERDEYDAMKEVESFLCDCREGRL